MVSFVHEKAAATDPQDRTHERVLWGDADPFTPLGGPVGEFFQRKLCAPSDAAGRPGARFAEVADCGHCPHDDRPEAVLAELLPWLRAECSRASR